MFWRHTINKALENFDVGIFKSVKDRYDKLTKEEKELAGKEIKVNSKKSE